MADQSPPPPSLGQRLLRLALLSGMVVIAWGIFWLAGWNYWEFWLKSGPVIGLATASFGWAWGGLDRNPGLVSADPYLYVSAVVLLVAVPIQAFGGHLRRQSHEKTRGFDILMMIPLVSLLVVAAFAWLLLIAPAQYFAFLVAGAPSRMAMHSNFRLHAKLYENGYLDCRESHRGDHAKPDKENGWWDASMRDRPVTIASAFMAASFLVIDTLLPDILAKI